MRNIVFAMVTLAIGACANAQVSPDEHAAHHPAAGNSATSAASPTDKPMNPATASAEPNMKAMQELMDKIHKTKDPAERKRLLAQHREAMHAQLETMKHMDCGMGMGGNMMSSGMAGKDADKPNAGASGEKPMGGGMMAQGGMMGQGGMMEGGMMKCHEMMQSRMQMMTGMMDQMLQHEDAEHAPAR